jgi:hypothetical protein
VAAVAGGGAGGGGAVHGVSLASTLCHKVDAAL